MKAKILIPVNDSETTRRTIQTVVANRQLMQNDIMLMHVVDVHQVERLIPVMQKDLIYESAEKSGRRLLENLAQPFREAGVPPTLRLERGTPEVEILKVVEAEEIELVILGRHQGSTGLRDVMFRSVANQILHSVKCPILLI